MVPGINQRPVQSPWYLWLWRVFPLALPALFQVSAAEVLASVFRTIAYAGSLLLLLVSHPRV